MTRGRNGETSRDAPAAACSGCSPSPARALAARTARSQSPPSNADLSKPRVTITRSRNHDRHAYLHRVHRPQ